MLRDDNIVNRVRQGAANIYMRSAYSSTGTRTLNLAPLTSREIIPTAFFKQLPPDVPKRCQSMNTWNMSFDIYSLSSMDVHGITAVYRNTSIMVLILQVFQCLLLALERLLHTSFFFYIKRALAKGIIN